MKKLLLITTALAVSAGVASANTPTTTTTATPPAAAATTGAATFAGQITSLTPTTVSLKNATGTEKTFTWGALKADASWTVGSKVTAQFDPSTNQLTKVEKN